MNTLVNSVCALFYADSTDRSQATLSDKLFLSFTSSVVVEVEMDSVT